MQQGHSQLQRGNTKSTLKCSKASLYPLCITGASPVGSLFHTILLDNLDDAVAVGNGLFGSIASSLQSIGQPMPHNRGFVPVVLHNCKALRQHLDGIHMTMPCTVVGQPLLLGLSHAHNIITPVSLSASVGMADGFLVGACSSCYILHLVLGCQLILTVMLWANMFPGLVVPAHVVVVWLLQVNAHHLNVQLSTHLGSNMHGEIRLLSPHNQSVPLVSCQLAHPGWRYPLPPKV